MASNFKLFYNQNRDSLHFHLYGDFDGMSAHELIHALEKHGKDYFEVFIDTNDLTQIHSFGVDVFQNNLNFMTKKNSSITFIGRHKRRFAA